MSLSPGYHPQSNGQTERVNQILEGSCHVWRPGILASGALAMGGIRHQPPGVCGLWYVSLPGLAWLSAPLFEFQEDEVAVPSVRANRQRCWVHPTFHVFRGSLCRSRLLSRCLLLITCYSRLQETEINFISKRWRCKNKKVWEPLTFRPLSQYCFQIDPYFYES